MQAAIYHQFGKAKDVIEVREVEKPEPQEGQIRVKLFCAGVNPSDIKMRSGTSRPLTGNWQIPSSDGAGIVDAIGPGVDRFKLGQRVWVFNAAFMRPQGTSSEFTVIESWMASSLPDHLSYAQGACLGIPVMTAHRCLFSDGPIDGKTVMISGGAGVVAHYAIQLAKWGGARVITTVSSDLKAQHAKAAGADCIINYRTENVVERVLSWTEQVGVDRVLEVDFGANLTTNAQILKPGGVNVMYAVVDQPALPLPVPMMMAKNIILRFTLIYTITPSERAQILSDIDSWLNTGKCQFAIAAKFPLKDVVQAHELIESGNKIGHVILEMD